VVLRAEAVRERLLKLEEVVSRLERMEKKAPGDFRDFARTIRKWLDTVESESD
jgi:predicted nuclease with TOPRIM domain